MMPRGQESGLRAPPTGCYGSGMTEEGADTVFESCPSCGGQVDVSDLAPMEAVACPSCGGEMRVRTLFDHYRIEDLRGVGGMSQVFLARDTHLNRLVALKVLNRDNSSNQERIGQFEREARLTASITHPNVVRVYGVGRAQGNFYIAMELVDGASLEDILREHGSLGEAQVLDIAFQTVDGLLAAQRIGLIHRDIKPGNILLTSEGKAKLVDFGLALVFEAGGEDSDEMWATPFYVSPEKLAGEPEDFRSDLYSLGSTLFHLLAARPPYDSQTASVDELREIKSHPVRLGAFAPRISEPTQEVVNRMIELKPQERYQSYEELLDAIRGARDRFRLAMAKKAQSANLPARRLATRQRRVLQWASLAAAVALLAVIGLVVWKSSGTKAGTGGTPTVPAGVGDAVESWQVGTMESGGVSERFLKARAALTSGDYQQASRDFLDVFHDARTRQPTVNWAGYSVALAHLLAGEPGKAREIFREMRGKPDFDDQRVGPAAPLFHLMAEAMEQPWPVPVAKLEEARAHPGWQAAAALIGLKNWEHGRFDNARVWLDSVTQSKPGPAFRWVEELGPQLRNYLSDAATLSTLETKDQFKRSGDVEGALAEARTALAQVKTQGRARRWVEARIGRLEAERDRLAKAEAENEQRNAAARSQNELKELDNVTKTLATMRTGYRFAEGVNELRRLNPQSTEARARHALLMWLWQGSEDFLNTLVADIGTHGYRGPLQPKEGAIVYPEVQVVKATRTTVVIQSSLVGIKDLPVAQMAGAQLAALASGFIDKTAGEAEQRKRRELLALFSLQAGRLDTARNTALLLEGDPDFKTRWQQLFSLVSAVSGASVPGT